MFRRNQWLNIKRYKSPQSPVERASGMKCRLRRSKRKCELAYNADWRISINVVDLLG